MGRKRHTPEEIVAKLRQVDVLVAQGQAVDAAARSIGVTQTSSATSCSGVRSSTACGRLRCSSRLGAGTTMLSGLTRPSAIGHLPQRWHYGGLRSPNPLRQPPQPSSRPQSTNKQPGSPNGG